MTATTQRRHKTCASRIITLMTLTGSLSLQAQAQSEAPQPSYKVTAKAVQAWGAPYAVCLYKQAVSGPHRTTPQPLTSHSLTLSELLQAMTQSRRSENLKTAAIVGGLAAKVALFKAVLQKTKQPQPPLLNPAVPNRIDLTDTEKAWKKAQLEAWEQEHKNTRFLRQSDLSPEAKKHLQRNTRIREEFLLGSTKPNKQTAYKLAALQAESDRLDHILAKKRLRSQRFRRSTLKHLKRIGLLGSLSLSVGALAERGYSAHRLGHREQLLHRLLGSGEMDLQKHELRMVERFIRRQEQQVSTKSAKSPKSESSQMDSQRTPCDATPA